MANRVGFSPWPVFSEAEQRAVTEVLRSGKVNYWTGIEGRHFESEFARQLGIRHAIALANGTLALELALRALQIGAGDEVIVTPRSFIASVSCVVAIGATPVFADVDRDSQNITAETVERVYSNRTRAVIPVHLAGMPCDLDSLLDLASSKRIALIEDCAQALGAQYKGRSVGTFGVISAWSFCQDKIVSTAGEGGMVCTKDDELWARLWSYKDHGKTLDAMQSHGQSGGFRWLHETFGTNARMLETQAVVGRLQLGRLREWSDARRANCTRIWDAARQIRGLRVPEIPPWARHAGYRAYVFVEPHALRAGWSRDRVIARCTEYGVPCFSGSCSEIYLEKAFDGTPWRPRQRLPVARELGETSLAFLVHPTLTDQEIEKTVDVLVKVMSEATS